MQVPFETVFSMNANGLISPKTTVRVHCGKNGRDVVTMYAGANITPKVKFDGISLGSLKGKMLEFERDGDIVDLNVYASSRTEPMASWRSLFSRFSLIHGGERTSVA